MAHIVVWRRQSGINPRLKDKIDPTFYRLTQIRKKEHKVPYLLSGKGYREKCEPGLAR